MPYPSFSRHMNHRSNPNIEDSNAEALIGRGLAFPMRRCPVEILSEIFVHALPEYPFSLSLNHAPLLFERVCRQWKAITRSTPALWSQISIDLIDGFQEDDLKIVTTCLARSGKHPLSIALGPEEPDSGLDIVLGNPALSLLATQCERWYAVRLRLPLEILCDLNVVRGRLPLLHSLSILTNDDEPEDNDTVVPLEIFVSAPRLRHFETTAQQLADIVTAGSLCLPWNGLTSLVIDERKAVDIWAILKDCPNLVELEAHINRVNPNGCLDVPAVALPCLRSLSLQIPESSTILSTLTLPVLQQASFTITLRYHAFDTSKKWHRRSGLARLLSQSKCTLSKLYIDSAIGSMGSHPTAVTRFREQDFIGCMEALPSLTEIDVSHNLSRLFLRAVMDQQDRVNALILPKLEKVALFAHAADSISWNLLAAFLKSRRVAGGQFELLRSLKLTVNGHASDPQYLDCLDILRTFESEGMLVEVTRVSD